MEERQGCLTAVLRLLGISLGPKFKPPAELPYRLRDDFLSAAELSFYRVLKLALKESVVILAKVNLGDVFFVVQPNENQAARNRIDRKHVDFLLCDPATMKPLAGIELDDSSHKRANRVDRDQLVDSVFEVAGLPLVRFPVREGYEPAKVVGALAPHLSHKSPIAPAAAPVKTAASPVCPKCNVPLIQRVASKGDNKGKAFWGCPNYPRCRETA